MKNIIRLLLLFMLLFSVFNSFSFVASQETTEAEETTETEELVTDVEDEISEEDVELAYEREVQVEADAEKVKIESQLKNGENKDKLSIQFQAAEGEPEIEFKYSKKSNSTDSDLEYKVKFEQIIEYEDELVNGTAGDGYQEGEEVSLYRFDNATWNDLVASVEMVGLEEINVFTASTTDGVFTLIMRISSSIVNLNNVTFTPNSLKFDIEIRSFDYKGTGTSLALETKVKSQFEQKFGNNTEEEAAGFGNNESQIAIGGAGAGYFSWAEFAVADGSDIDVLASKLTDSSSEDADELAVGESSGKLYFSFIVEEAAEIVWDPKVGVVSEGTSALIDSASTTTSSTTPVTSDGSSAPFFSLWFALIMISGFVVIRRKFI